MLRPSMVHDEHQKLYLRAEPSPEGRELLLVHRRRLHAVLESLEITPRVVERSDFHRTELFLGSPESWTHAFVSVGATSPMTAEDLAALVALPPEDRRILSAIPWRYEPFFTGRTSVAFVLRLKKTPSLLPTLLQSVASTLKTWETAGRFPAHTVAKLLAHPAYPLARETNGGTPHITLARGRVSLERHRDVRRTLRATPLVSDTPVPFVRIDLRMVRSSQILAPYAPLP